MENKWFKIFIVGLIALAILFGGYKYSQGDFGASFAGPGFNVIDPPTQTSTTTDSSDATKILSRNSSRIYGLVVNDSDTDLYIHFTNFADSNAASTTVIQNEGVRLSASGGNYEILPENMYIGDIWVASTTAAKKLLITER